MLTTQALQSEFHPQLTPCPPASYAGPFAEMAFDNKMAGSCVQLSVEKLKSRPAKHGSIASVTRRKGSNYKEMAVLYYGTDEAVCPAVLEKESKLSMLIAFL